MTTNPKRKRKQGCAVKIREKGGKAKKNDSRSIKAKNKGKLPGTTIFNIIIVTDGRKGAGKISGDEIQETTQSGEV